MVDTSAIASAYTGLNAAYKILSGFLNLKISSEVQAKVIELQGIIVAAQKDAFAAQTAEAALRDEVRSLKEEISQMEKWEAEKEKYSLQQVASGAFAYALKSQTTFGGETPHWLCTNCYENRHKSILQKQGTAQRLSTYKCPACSNSILVPWNLDPSGKH